MQPSYSTTLPKAQQTAVRGLILIKLIAAVLSASTILGGALPPAVAASVVSGPCQAGMAVRSMHAAAVSRACPGTPAKPPIPGNCAWMLGCLAAAVYSLPQSAPGLVVSESSKSVHWVGLVLLVGRTVPPDRSPPIALA